MDLRGVVRRMERGKEWGTKFYFIICLQKELERGAAPVEGGVAGLQFDMKKMAVDAGF